MTIPEQLRSAVARSHFSQDEIAARAGVSPKTVWNALRGRNVRSDCLFAVFGALGVPVVVVTVRVRKNVDSVEDAAPLP